MVVANLCGIWGALSMDGSRFDNRKSHFVRVQPRFFWWFMGQFLGPTYVMNCPNNDFRTGQ